MEPREALELNKLNIAAAGSGCQMRLGDLDNDGRLELVLIQPDVIADDRYFPHSVAAATAFSLEGDILWQIGTPAGDIPACNANLPAQIYDFDNDGSNEFLCVMDGEFCIFDGLNGTLKLKYPLPSPDAHDCFAIADLEGTGYAQNIILKNKYHMLWALDKNFNVIWTAVGNMGHFPLPCDLDGDGRDEVVVGYSVFSADGELLWKAEGMEKHPGSIWLCNLAQEKHANPSVLFGGTALRAYSSNGELLWEFSQTDTLGDIVPGNFRTDIKGIETAGVLCTASGINELFLNDYHGNTLFREKRTVSNGTTRLHSIHNFDADHQDLLLARRGDIRQVAIYDGMMNPIYTFSATGQVYTADLTGGGVPQVLIQDDETVSIYAAEEMDLSGAAVPYGRPQPKYLYNATYFNYGELEPWRNAAGYITGDFAAKSVYPWAETVAMCGGEDYETPISRADFIVLLVSALQLNAYERENFYDVKPNAYYYHAVGVAKKLGLVEEVKFSPELGMTAEAAIEIMKKAGVNPITQKEGAEELTLLDAAKLILQTLKK